MIFFIIQTEWNVQKLSIIDCSLGSLIVGIMTADFQRNLVASDVQMENLTIYPSPISDDFGIKNFYEGNKEKDDIFRIFNNFKKNKK